ncbi:MAG TPA: amidohydrolase family protein [Mobilitalea sp.]|nr:amidohydrolase family protein [Mobilitalea sp.]
MCDKIIDAHVHLWEQQHGMVNGKPVIGIGGGRSSFGGEIRQMLPAYMEDDKNTVERLISNMDYAGVSGCVVTQEYIDGNQDDYLLSAKEKYNNRLKICSLYEENEDWRLEGFDGVKICASRLQDKNLIKLLPVFQKVEQAGKFISIDLSDGEEQVEDMQYLIQACPNLRIAIGHFGMVTRPGWQKQIELACNKNVYIESGGLTWLFHKEFYPYPSAIHAIMVAKDICGINKLMWGSDYPRTMTAITYRMSIDFILRSDKLTKQEKAALFGDNAFAFYGFNDLPKPEQIPDML